MGAELLHVAGRTDRQTDMMELIVAFCNFASAPQKHACLNSGKKNLRNYVLRNYVHCSAGQFFYISSENLSERIVRT